MMDGFYKLFILILIGLFFSINNSYSKEDHLDELKKISKNMHPIRETQVKN